MKKPTIDLAFLIRSLDYGGAERQLVTLVKSLDKQQFNITVLYFYPGGALEQELKETGVQTIALNKKGRWDSIGFVRRLIRQIRQIKPDLLHSYLGVSNLLALLLKLFVPKTLMVWGVRASNTDLSYYDWLSRLVFQLECFCSRFPTLIIANSNAGKAYHICHGFPADKTIAIANGIDTETFKPDAQARIQVRAEWNISDAELLIGLVGRLDPMKDHPTFLKAAAQIAQHKDNVRFVCIGGGSEQYRNLMIQLAAESGVAEKTIWPGARADMPAVYNALDIACSSSIAEGFSNTIGEAMACGIPCVVTQVGDSAWIVGDTSWVVPPRNPGALAAACLSVLDSRDRPTEKEKYCWREDVRSRIIEQFSLAILVEKTSQALLNLLNYD